MDRMYGHLTSEERFQLTLEALAREDRTETDRLSSTCPRVTHSFNENDPVYADRLKASYSITTSVCLTLAQLSGGLMTIETSLESSSLFLRLVATEAAWSYHRGWEDGCEHAWWAAGKPGTFPCKESGSLADSVKEMADLVSAGDAKINDDEPQAALEDIRNRLLGLASALAEAFSRFCRTEMGVEPEVAVHAWCPQAIGSLEGVWEAADGTQIDEVLLEEYEATLTVAWRELVEDL